MHKIKSRILHASAEKVSTQCPLSTKENALNKHKYYALEIDLCMQPIN